MVIMNDTIPIFMLFNLSYHIVYVISNSVIRHVIFDCASGTVTHRAVAYDMSYS